MEINKSLIIPLKNETEEVVTILQRFKQFLKEDTELIVVLDDESDPTLNILKDANLGIEILISQEDPGASNAIKFGISRSKGKYICIAMGDGSDDPTQVEDIIFGRERFKRFCCLKIFKRRTIYW